MAQCMLITTLIPVRCKLMWNFVREIPEWLARRVSAWIGREAHADTMAQGSALSRSTHQSDRSARSLHPLFVCLLGVGTLNPVVVVFAAERCPATNATRFVSVQGKVTWNVINNTTLTPAKLNDILCVGDTVRVGAKSRAVLRLSNETTVPLDQNTIFRLKEDISDKEPTLIELLQGAIHVITRTPKPFKVNTPHINALVEGTEFYVGVSNEESRVAVIEGKVNVSNEQGAVLLTDNEAVTAKKGQAPQKTLTIKPRDAVQWALHYPPLFDPRSRSGGQNLSASHDLYSQGKITEAIESLDAIPQAERTGDYYSYRAGLLLLVGRADEAEPDIETALRENGNNTDAVSLKAIIAVVRNDKAKALELANQAVNIDDKSASARIASSYALQANFKIEDALKAAREATLRDANNALAWARVAELELSIPNYDKSKRAAEKAVALNPNLARTQSVLGFANLTRIDIDAAKANFNKAIELDQADPLPRLGLGLATIREGNLEQGREHIEIAASLDPENSLVRSYLGKAYYEEKRSLDAGKQFELAKQRDPQDPTPYLYDAIRKQSDNRFVEALQELKKSIELNGNRAVYRSRLSLDEDRASRASSLGRALSAGGFGLIILPEVAKSLSYDPANSSSHQLLSEVSTLFERRETARVSELLQSQLLQPVSGATLKPSAPFIDLNINSSNRIRGQSYNDYGSLFDRDSLNLSASGLIGNHGTLADEITISKSSNKSQISFGQFHYESTGFRKNNDLRHDIYNLFGQIEINQYVNVQVEMRERTTKQGDLSLSFNPDLFDESYRRKIAQSTFRFGATARPTRNDTFLLSAIVNRRQETQRVDSDEFSSQIEAIDKGYQVESQYILHGRSFNLTTGLGHYEIDVKNPVLDTFKVPIEDLCDTPPCSFESRLAYDRKRSNAYTYATFTGLQQFIWTIGGSLDHYQEGNISFRQFNPKLGISWDVTSTTTVRLAAFRTSKPALVVEQTLEPTQIAGFNQSFEDLNGTRTFTTGVGVDSRFGNSMYVGAASVQRNSKHETLVNQGADFLPPYQIRSSEFGLNFYTLWAPLKSVVLSAQPEHVRFSRNTIPEGELSTPRVTRTIRAPFSVHYFATEEVHARVSTTFYRQRISYEPSYSDSNGQTSFWLTDIEIGIKFPHRCGTALLGIDNVFDRRFNYLDESFRTSQPSSQRRLPARSIYLKAQVNF